MNAQLSSWRARFVLIAVLVVIASFWLTSSAQAQCDDGSPQPPKDYCPEQCTWWARHRAIQTGWNLPHFAGDDGNATNWITSAQSQGLETGTEPRGGAIAVWRNTCPGYNAVNGHVAFVEEVRSNGGFSVSEQNYVSPQQWDRWITSDSCVEFIYPPHPILYEGANYTAAWRPIPWSDSCLSSGSWSFSAPASGPCTAYSNPPALIALNGAVLTSPPGSSLGSSLSLNDSASSVWIPRTGSVRAMANSFSVCPERILDSATNFPTDIIGYGNATVTGDLNDSISAIEAAWAVCLPPRCTNTSQLSTSQLSQVSTDYRTATQSNDVQGICVQPPPSTICSSPTLLAPANGQTSSIGSVTFSWVAPNCTGLTGYTLHINQSPDPEAQPFLLDTGVGGTSYSYALSSGGVYYWHVASWTNSSQRSGWTTRQLTLVSNPPPTPPPTTPPPPSSDGIEIVSVSNHMVSPGAQINPSVTIRVNSGQLLVSRGDHLHAVPEDTTNTFGAWPVQAVKSNVATGGTYTFDVNNDTGFRMTAPNTPGNYVSRWQLRVGGNHIGPVVEIPVTVQTAAPPPTPSGWRAQYWNGYFSDNPWGNPRCRSDDYTDSIPFTKNWGSSGPGSGCSGDRFSVLYERTFSFTGGTYRFHCHRDGYCRIFIPALNISHQEEGGPFSGIDWTVNIPAGNWQVKIEYSHKRENGDARLEFWWQGPESYLPPRDVNCAADPYQWCAGYRVAWNSPGDSYMLRRLEGSGYLDHDWAYGSPGYGIYNDFSAEWSRLARFDAGLYRFYTTHDDGVRINLDNQLILDQWGTCCRQDSVDVWVAPGDHRVTVNWFDSGGAANIRVWWQRITPCYSLSATTTPSGLGSVATNPAPNCPSDGSEYVAGTNVTLVANPTAPNDFVGWGGDVSGSTQSASLVMDADKQVTAGFDRCYSLQLGSDPNGVIAINPSPNCSAGTHYRADTNLALYASASSGYRMDSWLGDLSGNTNPVVISMNGNKSISASFVPLDPLAVTLETFEATVDAGHVLVLWQTTAEIDNAGFNLYRASDPAGPQALLAFVPSQAPGSNQGFAYEWADSDVLPDQTYYYWLEAVDLAGGLTMHGPVSVVYQLPTAVSIKTFAALTNVSRPSIPWLVARSVLLTGIAMAAWPKQALRTAVKDA